MDSRIKEIRAVIVLEVSLAPAVANTVAIWLENETLLSAVWGLLGILGVCYIYRSEIWSRLSSMASRSALDLFDEISCHEVACLCAGVRFNDRALDNPQVREWIKHLCEEGSAYSNFPIGEHSRLAFGQWLQIVNGICFARNEPMPRYFRRAQKTIEAAMHD